VVLGETGALSARTELAAQVLGAGPLERLLADPEVTDVLVNAGSGVWVDRGDGLARTDCEVGDELAVRRLAVRLAGIAGRRLDDTSLDVISLADKVFVVMTADLSCLKNVPLVLETMDSLGYEKSKVQLVLNRSNAYTGINVSNAESALGRKIDYQVINEYRGAISALNSGEPFMSSRPDGPLGRSVTDFARALDAELAAEALAAG